ncbi:MAG: protein kinase [Deltaproteobacteria bacterium]|nr:protein kinase [Deltaproteobacteria bacterium]
MAVKAPVVAGKYTLLRRLGAGGMAEVFLAKQTSSLDEGGPQGFEKLVVIKRILPHLASGPSNTDFVRMFLDEGRLASDLRHPNIVSIIDVGKTSDTYFIVMEFLHGQDVRKVQRKNAAWGEQVPIGHACRMAIDAATGLHYAHHKADLSGRQLHIVHRDVSPQNMIVTYDGITKIVDFGIAKAATQTTHTSTGVLKGKYTYMSPEQAAGEQVDPRTDQFALGIVLWELLTMRRLFKRETEMATLEAIMGGQIPRPSRFREDLPKAIDDVVMKALHIHRDKRFRDCEELALALEDALAKLSVVHSAARLSQYMRRLFADTLAEEATLGLVNPDGSLSKNLTPFTLPPPEGAGQDRMDQGHARPSSSDDARMEPAKGPKKATQVDATTADRKSVKSKDDSGSRGQKARAPEPQSIRTESDANELANDHGTDPTVVEEKRQKPALPAPAPRREPQRARRTDAVPRPSLRLPLAAVAIGALVAASLVAAFIAFRAWTESGLGTLVVRSEPRGALVYLDGQPTGQTTPALLKGVEVGTPHKLRVELSGKSAEEIVTVPRRGVAHEVRIDLP